MPAPCLMVRKIRFSDLWLVSASITWDDGPHTQLTYILGKYMCKEPNSMSVKTAQWVEANATPNDHGVEETD